MSDLNKGVQFHFSACAYLVFPTPFIEENILSLWVFLVPLPYIIRLDMQEFINRLSNSILWINVSVFIPVSYWHKIAIALWYSLIRKCDVTRFVLLSQNCSGYSGSFVVPYEFQDFSLLLKILLELWKWLHWIYRWLWMAWTLWQY